MAAAEARAAWQRTANRCFVQEDAKRAPKLACCPSASVSSKLVDAEPANATDGHDNPNVGFMPVNKYSNLPPESRWWLQLQPNYGYQKALANEQLNTLDADLADEQLNTLNSTSEAREVQPKHEDDSTHIYRHMNVEPSMDSYCGTAAISMKKDPEVDKKELKTVYDKSAQEPFKPNRMEESYELLEIDPVSCSKQANKNSFDSDPPWIGGEKAGPWWRIADGDELVSLVAQRSLDLIENCDLPRPQNTHFKRGPYAYLGNLDCDGILPSSKDLKAPRGGLSSPTVKIRGSLNLGSARGKQWSSFEEQSRCGSDKQNSDGPTQKGTTETQVSDSDPSKAQLLEALRHSQTRAREAEKAAKEAYAEKEHVLKLFFRQASHLFAYRQWFQLLQLENLYFQIKNNNQPIATLFPVALPWTPLKTKKSQKNHQKSAKGKRGKRGRPTHEFSKFTVAFALGLTLVGAGLLLGWTVGWMLPAF